MDEGGRARLTSWRFVQYLTIIQQEILEQAFNEGKSGVRQLVQTMKEHGLVVLRAEFTNLFGGGSSEQYQVHFEFECR